jgi:hypothetical protein
MVLVASLSGRFVVTRCASFNAWLQLIGAEEYDVDILRYFELAFLVSQVMTCSYGLSLLFELRPQVAITPKSSKLFSRLYDGAELQTPAGSL